MEAINTKKWLIGRTGFIAIMLILYALLFLTGCEDKEDQEINQESFDYHITEMEARFLGETVVDTSTMDEQGAESVIEDVNEYLNTAEMMVDLDPEASADGGQWILILTTDDGEEIRITEAYEIINDELETGGTIRADSEVLGYFTVKEFRDLLRSFDAWMYLENN